MTINKLTSNVQPLDVINQGNEIVDSSTLSNFLPSGTTITVETDGSGNFTKLRDAVSYLTGKWSNGTVYIQLGNGIFNEGTEVLYINADDGALFNIPSLVIQGNGRNNSIIQFSRVTQGSTIYIRSGFVTFKNLKVKNETFDSSLRYWGFTANNVHSALRVVDCDTENLSNAIVGGQGARIEIVGTINITNALAAGLAAQTSAQICSHDSPIINFTNCVFGIRTWHNGLIMLANPTLTFTNVTTKCSQSPNTITADGIITGFTI